VPYVPLPSNGTSQTSSTIYTRESAFPKPGHKLAEGCKATHESLNVLDVLDWTDPSSGQDLIGVCFNVAFGNDIPQELPPEDSKGAFPRIQVDVEAPEVAEGFFQVGDESAPPP
jgi:hypothetical protein